VDEELAAFEAVSLKTIRKLLDRYPLDRVTTLALGPLGNVKSPEVDGKKEGLKRNGRRGR
jgi:hypothetical protein